VTKKSLFIAISIFTIAALACGFFPVSRVEAASVKAATPVPQYASDACMADLKNMLDEAYGNGEDSSEDSGRALVKSKFTRASGDDSSVTLVTYSVNGNKISSPEYGTKVPSQYKKYVKDTELHSRIWKIVTDIIPLDQRKDIDTFTLFTDGQDETTGSVGAGATDDTWSIELDVLDSENIATLSTTLVHEFGHLITLGSSQIEYYADTCDFYMASDGCSGEDSYVNRFYSQFWTDREDEWKELAKPDEDGVVDEDGAYSFYENHPEEFVSDYAATHPEEDIAESWTYFIYSDTPKGDTVADQKIRFFYMFPELVAMRRNMEMGLCKYTEK
jgi:hypothetical protein